MTENTSATPDERRIAELVRRLTDAETALEAAFAGRVDAIVVGNGHPPQSEEKRHTRVSGQVDAVVDPGSGQTILLRRARDELGDRVQERTAELARANALLRAEIAEREEAQRLLRDARDALEQRVAERTAELSQANERLRETAACLEEANLQFMALARVGHKVQEAFQDGEIVATVVEELRKLDYHSAILFWERDDLVLRYTSLEPELLAALQELFGSPLFGTPLPLTPEVLWDCREEQQSLFVPDPWNYIPWALGTGPGSTLQRLIEMAGMGGLIVAPLIARDKTLGILVIWSRDLREANVSAVTAFANQLAIAIENARLFETIQTQHEQLRALGARLSDARESERRALARELHDQLGQNLSALGINLSILRVQLSKIPSSPAMDRISDSLAMVQQMTDRVRDLMADLRPPVLDDYGLLSALRWHAEKFGQRTGLEVIVLGEEPSPRLDEAVEINLFRIAQEALINVAKHARASTAVLTLETEGNLTRLLISDDGIGFDPGRATSAAQRQGWGLIGMAERAEAQGGCCLIESSPGQGTKVIVEILR